MKFPGSSTIVGSRVGKLGLPVSKRLVPPPQVSRVGSFGASRPKLPLSSSTSTIPTASRLASSTSSIPASRFVSATAARATPSIRPLPSTIQPTALSRQKVPPSVPQTQSAPTVLVTAAVVELIPPVTTTPPLIIEEVAAPLPTPIIIAPPLPQLPRPLPKAVDSTSSPKRKALRVWEAPEKVNIFSFFFFFKTLFDRY